MRQNFLPARVTQLFSKKIPPKIFSDCITKFLQKKSKIFREKIFPKIATAWNPALKNQDWRSVAIYNF